MRVRIMSDLHLDRLADGGRAFLRDLPDVAADALILAGDLADGEALEDALAAFLERFAAQPVLYVPGNHEYWRMTAQALCELFENAAHRFPHFHWLENSSYRIGDTTFHGTTLWFPEPDRQTGYHLLEWNDALSIPDFERVVYGGHARSCEYLSRHVSEGDVVITHHLPSPACFTPSHRHSRFDHLFMVDMESVMREKRPRLWIHGHVHAPVDTHVHQTRIVANPSGPGHPNPHFIPGFHLDL